MIPFPWIGDWQRVISAVIVLFLVLVCYKLIRGAKKQGTARGERIWIAVIYIVISLLVMVFGIYYILFSIIAALPIVIIDMRREAKENRIHQEQLSGTPEA